MGLLTAPTVKNEFHKSKMADGRHFEKPLNRHINANRCSTFDNMKVLIFCAFCLKTPIYDPKIGVFGDLTHLVGSNINVTTKRH